MSENLVFVMDWSNIARGQREMGYGYEEYDKETGFRKLKGFLNEIGKPTKLEVYTPIHDIWGHFEFLRDQGFTIILCPQVLSTLQDTTDLKLMANALDYIENYTMGYLCIGSGDGHFVPIAEAAKKKGIKIALVYGSDVSLSHELWKMADSYPDSHPKAGQQMIHLYSPTNRPS